MKSALQAEASSGIPATLIRSVIRQLGDRSYLEDVYNHGADAGYPGFTNYCDTVKFFKAHQSDISMLVNNLASDMGEKPADMVANFACLHYTDPDELQEIYRALGGRINKDDTMVPNALAWFALEEVARAMVEEE
jgi:hypothetical protein